MSERERGQHRVPPDRRWMLVLAVIAAAVAVIAAIVLLYVPST